MAIPESTSLECPGGLSTAKSNGHPTPQVEIFPERHSLPYPPHALRDTYLDSDSAVSQKHSGRRIFAECYSPSVTGRISAARADAAKLWTPAYGGSRSASVPYSAPVTLVNHVERQSEIRKWGTRGASDHGAIHSFPSIFPSSATIDSLLPSTHVLQLLI